MWITPTGTRYDDKSDAVFHAVLKSKAARDHVIREAQNELLSLFAQRLLWITQLCDRGRPCPVADEILLLAGIKEVKNGQAKGAGEDQPAPQPSGRTGPSSSGAEVPQHTEQPV